MRPVSRAETLAGSAIFFAAGILIGVAADSSAAMLTWWIVTGLAWFTAHRLGRRKGHDRAGFWCGLLFSWAAVLVLLFVPKTRDRKVAEARERMLIEQEARSQP